MKVHNNSRVGDELTLKTDGLRSRFDYEISVKIDSPELKEGAFDFIELVTRYVEAVSKLSRAKP